MEALRSNMLAIIEQTDYEHNCYMDNTRQFILLMLLKVFMDGSAMYLCCFRPLLSFFNMCSVSIVLVDLVLTVSMIATLWLDVQMTHMAMCSIMANFSAAYSALPVPLVCLAILDYYLEDICAGRKYIKLVRNPVLIILMWSIAGLYAHVTVDATLLEQSRNIKYIVCEIKESKAVTYSIVGLTTVMFITLLPFLSLIPHWVKEADRISEAREEIAERRTSDLMIDINGEDTKCTKKEFAMPRPPMCISLLICFGVFWIPYLTVTTLCVMFEFGIPAYIGVNLLWVQCVNSLLAGVVFWVRSDIMMPYSSQPENVCLWQAYWHLSTGTEDHHQLFATIFNPSKGERSTPFSV
ncbi:probable G-protein coupled receptor 160 [Boleophthalmus pectinirostris]|uniref:probable G-protein coupled receptor 160 n=1 Tax=Boleophthalmus pectinirostris TaxID=150288 RepID=UPI000A1C50EB|nr:probable G-protein coupled receptor 160 [Boleophthalmus pectinirostris]